MIIPHARYRQRISPKPAGFLPGREGEFGIFEEFWNFRDGIEEQENEDDAAAAAALQGRKSASRKARATK